MIIIHKQILKTYNDDDDDDDDNDDGDDYADKGL